LLCLQGETPLYRVYPVVNLASQPKRALMHHHDRKSNTFEAQRKSKAASYSVAII